MKDTERQDISAEIDQKLKQASDEQLIEYIREIIPQLNNLADRLENYVQIPEVNPSSHRKTE